MTLATAETKIQINVLMMFYKQGCMLYSMFSYSRKLV